MPKSLIVAGRYTYCHDDSKEPSCPVDVHEIFIEISSVKTFLIYSTIFLMLLTFCFSLISKGESSVSLIWAAVVVSSFMASLKLNEIRKETVVIIPAFGIQLETLYWSGRISRRFVPIGKILRPILNECVTPVTCYWSLALILQGENQLMPVFQVSRLPIRVLIPVWKALRAMVEISQCPPVVSEAC